MRKLTLISVFVAIVAMLASSCQQPEEPTTTIEIEQSVNIGALGGTTRLEYTIGNPVAGATLTPSTPTVEWLTDIVVDESSISFTAQPNVGVGATLRQTTLSLGYNNKELAIVTIEQQTMECSFSLTGTNITPETIDVTVVPTNDQMSYLVSIAPKSFIEQNGGLTAYVMLEAEAYRNSFYGDLLDDYLRTGTFSETLTIQGAPEEPMLLWVAGVVRDNDKARTPIVATEPVAYEFQFYPYPTLSLINYSVHFDTTEGGTYRLKYNVDFPYEGGVMDFQLSEGGSSWIHNIRVEDREIVFDYDANPYPIERTCELYITYSYAEVCVLSISQVASLEMKNITFEITAKELHYDRIVVDCTPSDLENKYVIGAIAKKDFESSSHESDPTNIPKIDLESTYYRPVPVVGAQTDYLIKNTAYSYDTNWYIYAYAVNDAEDAAISEVYMQLVELVDDRPYFVWPDESVVSTEYSNTFSVGVDGGTYTVRYDVENDHTTGVITIEEPYDDTLVKGSDGKRVIHNPEDRTITFTVSPNTTKRERSTYIYLKYFASEGATYSDANTSLKIKQSGR